MQNPDFLTLTMRLLRWLCLWTHWYDTLSLTIGLAEIAILLWMLRLDKRNHELYADFFRARTDYYERRYRRAPNKKPAEMLGGSADNLVVLPRESYDGERETDALLGIDCGVEPPPVGDAPPPDALDT